MMRPVDGRRRPLSDAQLAHLRREMAPRARSLAADPLLGGLDWSTYSLVVDEKPRWVLRLHQGGAVRALDEARRLWKVLEALRGLDLPVPDPVLFDEGPLLGAPIVVMTRLAGAVRPPPDDPEPWLDRLAAILATIHRTDIGRLPADFRRCADPAKDLAGDLDRAAPAGERAAWSTAIATLARRAGQVDASDVALLHRDFWFGNVLWSADRVSGVVDWSSACIGPPTVDVAYARLDMHLSLGAAAADRFRSRYEAHGGRVADLGFWDLRATLPALRFLSEWLEGYAEVGLPLPPVLARERLEEFTRSSLARL